MKSHALGKTWAMSPGVRTIPAAIELPIAAETPNHTPSTCSSRPRFRLAAGAGTSALVEGPSNVLDNVESQVSVRNSAIIMAGWQNASWKSHRCNVAVSSFRALEWYGRQGNWP